MVLFTEYFCIVSMFSYWATAPGDSVCYEAWSSWEQHWNIGVCTFTVVCVMHTLPINLLLRHIFEYCTSLQTWSIHQNTEYNVTPTTCSFSYMITTNKYVNQSVNLAKIYEKP